MNKIKKEQLTKEQEKRFDKKFPEYFSFTVGSGARRRKVVVKRRIKQFLASELSRERERIREKIEKMKKYVKYPTLQSKARNDNELLDDILKEIKKGK